MEFCSKKPQTPRRICPSGTTAILPLVIGRNRVIHFYTEIAAGKNNQEMLWRAQNSRIRPENTQDTHPLPYGRTPGSLDLRIVFLLTVAGSAAGCAPPKSHYALKPDEQSGALAEVSGTESISIAASSPTDDSNVNRPPSPPSVDPVTEIEAPANNQDQEPADLPAGTQDQAPVDLPADTQDQAPANLPTDTQDQAPANLPANNQDQAPANLPANNQDQKPANPPTSDETVEPPGSPAGINVEMPHDLTMTGLDASKAVSIPENSQTLEYRAQAEVNGQPDAQLTYAISGGADATLFSIDRESGAISFMTAPDHEVSKAADQTNSYTIIITASATIDGTALAVASAMQTLTITVTDINDQPPVFTSPSSVNVTENTVKTSDHGSLANNATIIYQATAVADLKGDEVTYVITGKDAAAFGIDPDSGAIWLRHLPDFETQSSYDIDVIANAGPQQATRNVLITVINDPADDVTSPVFHSRADWSVTEGTNVTGYQAMAVAASGTVTYEITGGPDAGLFTIDQQTGILSFTETPDFEAPIDHDGDQINNLTITATATSGDGLNSRSASQQVIITVANRNDVLPVVISAGSASIDENIAAHNDPSIQGDAVIIYTAMASKDTAGPYVIFSLAAEDTDQFGINSQTGEVWLRHTPDHETQSAKGLGFSVTGSSGALQSVAHHVVVNNRDLNDVAPVFTSGASASVGEDDIVPHADSRQIGTAQAIYHAAATPDRATDLVTYSIAGPDADLFGIDADTGNIWFRHKPTIDVDTSYTVDVTARVASLTSTQSVTITVANNPASNVAIPVFSSLANWSVQEGTTDTSYRAVALAASGTVTYEITGGPDAHLFVIHQETGLLAFHQASDFETPHDKDEDNIYDITITATATSSDGQHQRSATKLVTIAVTNNPADDVGTPVFSSPSKISVHEGTKGPVYRTVAETARIQSDVIIYDLVNKLDHEMFTIDRATGDIAFLRIPDFDNPTDGNHDNIYEITVEATSRPGVMSASNADLSQSQTLNLQIEVQNVFDAPPVFISGQSISVKTDITTHDSASQIGQAHAIYKAEVVTDAAAEILTFSIDQNSMATFGIDPMTGRIWFRTPPDHTIRSRYEITVTATSTEAETNTRLSSKQTLTIDVKDPELAPSSEQANNFAAPLPPQQGRWAGNGQDPGPQLLSGTAGAGDQFVVDFTDGSLAGADVILGYSSKEGDGISILGLEREHFIPRIMLVDRSKDVYGDDGKLDTILFSGTGEHQHVYAILSDYTDQLPPWDIQPRPLYLPIEWNYEIM